MENQGTSIRNAAGVIAVIEIIGAIIVFFALMSISGYYRIGGEYIHISAWIPVIVIAIYAFSIYIGYIIMDGLGAMVESNIKLLEEARTMRKIAEDIRDSLSTSTNHTFVDDSSIFKEHQDPTTKYPQSEEPFESFVFNDQPPATSDTSRRRRRS